MLMSVIYSYFYSILKIIIWTASVWMKIIFYSSLEKLSAMVRESIFIIPTTQSNQSVKIIIFLSFFLFNDYMLCLLDAVQFFFPVMKHGRADRRLALLLFYIFMTFFVCCLRHLVHFLSLFIRTELPSLFGKYVNFS